MISIEATLSKGWLARAIGVAFDQAYYFDPSRRREIDRKCNDYARTNLKDLDIVYTESNLGRRRFLDDSQVLVGGIQPNMILGLLLGADFIPHDDKDADISPACMSGRDPGALPSLASLLEHGLIRKFDDQIHALRKKGSMPIPPFFWDASGRAAVHGALTTAQKLWGEGIFIDMLTKPVPSRGIMEWITEAYILLVDHYSKLHQAPLDVIHVGECSACMVSPELFCEFIVPFLDRFGESLGPVRFHSCGSSDHILKALKDVKHLSSLDMGGETSVAAAREIFGRDLPLSIAPPARDLTADDPERVLEWARRTIAENGEGELAVIYHLEPEYKLETVRALHEFVKG